MQITLSAHDIPALLQRAPAAVTLLSLDCFDTLIWRNVQAPSDIFAGLDIVGGAIEPRVRAEIEARRVQAFRTGRNEVSIEAIHARLLPGAGADEIAAAVRREIDEEARHCFGFAPVVALIHEAKRRGLRVIVVSDTYFGADQLRELIGRAAGPDVAAAIDRIFTSSDHGRSKGEGLFAEVLHAMEVGPEAVLHLGDNPHADQAAPAALGIASARFEPFEERVETRLRHEAVAAVMLDPAIRQTVPARQPHRPLLSLRSETDPAFVLGHDVIGPILHGFAEWVRDEARALAERSGRRVRPLFLLRDGYLPMRLFETLDAGIGVGPLAISRLTATRAGLTDPAAVRALVERDAGRHRLDVLAGLLLLDLDEARALVGPGGGTAELERAVLAPETTARILRRSAGAADRLIAHVRRAGVEEGDMVMLVDLGYHGSVQDRIAPLLADRMRVEVAGRYLLLREKEPSGLDKKGWFDKRHYGREALTALGSSIAVIEQICTCAEGSVVDYRADGSPIREQPDEKGAQSDTRDRIQAGAVAFGRAAAALGRVAPSDDDEGRRQAAAAILARLMYLPSTEEVAVIGDFTHDANLGSASRLKMLDGSNAQRGLRRRGLHYVQGTGRMFLPGELQDQGLALNLALFGIVRGALDLRESDFRTGGLRLPVILATPRGDCMVEIDAYATHDGYYRLTIPARGDLTVAVLFGGLCEAVQIDEVCFETIELPTDEPEISRRREIEAPFAREGMEPVAGDLFRCTPGAALLVPPLPGIEEGRHILCVAFRPVVARAAVAARKAA